MKWEIHQGEALRVLRTLPASSVHCIVTSPPYLALRDYGAAEQLGVERTLDAYVNRLVRIFREARRVLREDGSLWLNLGDTYAGRGGWGAGIKPKDLMGVPWTVATALRADGWFLRSDVIWEKTNGMPESVRDRPTNAHEHLFLLTKSRAYYYEADAIREPLQASTIRRFKGKTTVCKRAGAQHPKISRMNPILDEPGRKERLIERGRNKRTVWRAAVTRYHGAHFATYPPKLIEPCILVSCPAGGTVLDPFCGAGTTGVVALQHGREFVGIEINPEYTTLARERLKVGRNGLSY